MRNVRLEEAQSGIKIAGRNINNLRYAYDTNLIAEREKNLRIFLVKLKRRVKNLVKIQHLENEDQYIWSRHFMTNRWGNNGNSDRLYFSGLQNHCRWSLQS